MPRFIDRHDVQRLLAAGAQLLDVMPREEFEEFHLPGAVHLPLRSLDEDAVRALRRDADTVVYCYDFQ
jgi:rhodanese-related sulfurtransferase